jgi:hypothetical protein
MLAKVYFFSGEEAFKEFIIRQIEIVNNRAE